MGNKTYEVRPYYLTGMETEELDEDNVHCFVGKNAKLHALTKMWVLNPDYDRVVVVLLESIATVYRDQQKERGMEL
jgi:hypothetical protein